MSSQAMQKAVQAHEISEYARRCAEALPFVVDQRSLDESQARMALAFSGASAPELARCTKASIARAITLSALSGLYPGGTMPDVWLIPRRNKGIFEVVWQIAARGYQRLAHRQGYTLDCALVFKGEHFKLTRGTDVQIEHEPVFDKPQAYDDIRLGYAVATSPEGRRSVATLRRDQIDQRRAKAQTQKIWNEWHEEMALKTVAAYAGRRELFPCDPNVRHAVDADQAAVVMAPAAPAPARLERSDFVALAEHPESSSTPSSLSAQVAPGANNVQESPDYDPNALEQRVREAGIYSAVAAAYGEMPVDWRNHVAAIEARCEESEKRQELS